MTRFRISNLGQIKEADITLGDLTVLVGPQASGKSIALQLMKLTMDAPSIKRTLNTYAYDWKGNRDQLLDLYFGEGMHGIWKPDTVVWKDNERIGMSTLMGTKHRKKEQLFYIPAQRVMTIQNGWPRPFNDYAAGDPFVVRYFSESLRTLMEKGLGAGQKTALFPQAGRMKNAFREAIDKSIFFNGQVELDTSGMKKRFVLSVNNAKLPYMTWSAGQREFMPLLLGLYWLMPSSKVAMKDGIKYVVIEEPEMGLHPYAIKSLLLIFLELVHRGYKVIISTHSPIILELFWAIQGLRETQADLGSMFDLFGLKKSPGIARIMDDTLRKIALKAYAFERTEADIHVKDISSLDPDSRDGTIADWGGLTSFSSDISEILSKAYQKHGV